MSRLFCPLLALALAGCFARYTEARLGEPLPPRAASCEVSWLSIDGSPANDHRAIAMLSNMEVGPDPSSPAAREEVRRRVCALGGDAVSLVVSANDRAGYVVWAKRDR